MCFSKSTKSVVLFNRPIQAFSAIGRGRRKKGPRTVCGASGRGDRRAGLGRSERPEVLGGGRSAAPGTSIRRIAPGGGSKGGATGRGRWASRGNRRPGGALGGDGRVGLGGHQGGGLPGRRVAVVIDAGVVCRQVVVGVIAPLGCPHGDLVRLVVQSQRVGLGPRVTERPVLASDPRKVSPCLDRRKVFGSRSEIWARGVNAGAAVGVAADVLGKRPKMDVRGLNIGVRVRADGDRGVVDDRRVTGNGDDVVAGLDEPKPILPLPAVGARLPDVKAHRSACEKGSDE